MPGISKITGFIERNLTPYLLLIVNLIIIFLAEILGHGRLFYETGLIHGVALVFIFLAGYRIFKRYYVFDPELRQLLRASLFAQGFFAVSHLVEFVSFQFLHTYSDAAFANVVNFYIISLLCLLMGAQYVLAVYNKKVHQWNRAAMVVIVFFVGLTLAFLVKNSLISLEVDEVAPYAYAIVVLGIGIYGLVLLTKVARLYPLLKPFVGYLIQATILIFIATLPNIFYEILGQIGVDSYQVIYLSHFTFYAALSIMFLAYGDSLKIGGLHEHIRNMVERGEIKL